MSISPPTTQLLDVGEGRIAYDVTGDPSGPLVVMAPGMGDLRSVYRALAPALARAGYRVATMDLRGHGDSDATFAQYDTVATGRDLLALVDHLGGPAVLIGNSMSSGSAVWAAAERPEAVRALVLTGPFVRDGDVSALQRAMFRVMISGPWASAAWRMWVPKLYPGRRPDDLDDHLAAIRDSLRQEGHRKAFVQTTRTSHAPVAARLREVRAPALVVMGAADPDWPDPAAEAEFIAEAIGAQTALIPEAGHYPQAEYPEVVIPVVAAFLDQAAPVAEESATDQSSGERA